MPGAIARRITLSRELELERIVSLQEARDLSGLSIDTWRRNYRHLIIQLSPRRQGVKLRDVFAIGQPADMPPAA